MSDNNIIDLPRPWREHLVIRSRKQRKTGNVIFVAERRAAYGVSYIKFRDPVHAAEFCFMALQFGRAVRWESGE
jgi:hypothetical protein